MTAAAPQDTEALAGLDAYIDGVMERWHVSGLSLAVARGNDAPFPRGYGFFPVAAGRRPGDFYFIPAGDDDFILFGRGKTGGAASFRLDSHPIEGTIQGARVRQVSARLHSGLVRVWGES